MSRSQRTPSRAPSTASNNDMANNKTALLGALLAFGGASKSNGDILRSRGNSPATPASSLRGRPPTFSPSPSYRQPATAPATARVSPAAAVSTKPHAAASAVRNDSHDDTKTQRPTPPPKPRRLSEHHYKPRPISPATSFVGILEKNTLRRPALKQQDHPNEVSSSGMEVRAQAEAATTQTEGLGRRQKDPTQRQKVEVFSNNSRPTSSRSPADRRIQERTRAQVEARLAEAQERARSQALSSSEDDEYVSASEDTARSPTVAARAGTTAIKQPPQPPPTRSRPPPGTRKNLNNPSQPIEISPAPRASISSARSVSSQSNPSLNAAYHQLYPRRTTNLTLGEDLANAMVASSIATSRASSPSKLAPPSSSSRRHNHPSPFQSRTPSPIKKAKGMRHTLRDPESSSSESETEQHPYGKHKKKRHLRLKHPNKHHEGMSS